MANLALNFIVTHERGIRCRSTAQYFPCNPLLLNQSSDARVVLNKVVIRIRHPLIPFLARAEPLLLVKLVKNHFASVLNNLHCKAIRGMSCNMAYNRLVKAR